MKLLAVDFRTPSWMKQWLEKRLVPPGYNVEHKVPLSVGGADIPANMRLVLKADHDIHHFRTTHLRKQRAPEGLVQFWLGHAGKSITDGYDRVREDEEYRKEVALSGRSRIHDSERCCTKCTKK